MSYWHHGDYPRIIALDRISTQIDPHFLECYETGGWLMESMGNLKDAEAYYRQGVANNPDTSELYYHLGFFYFNTLHDYHQAVNTFRQGISQSDADINDWRMLAHSYEHAGEYTEGGGGVAAHPGALAGRGGRRPQPEPGAGDAAGRVGGPRRPMSVPLPPAEAWPEPPVGPPSPPPVPVRRDALPLWVTVLLVVFLVRAYLRGRPRSARQGRRRPRCWNQCRQGCGHRLHAGPD